MNSGEIRTKFLEFFDSKRHEIVPSAPLIVTDDPTLMFTNAGMNQFKEFFLGNRTPKHKRVADTQKCLRVSGKHNDLEEVGIDTYHHTMFEMLGNWSFGNYFKKKAIDWAWELLTEVYDLPEKRMYATVFGGDEKDGLDRDQESFDIWSKYLPEERILYCNKDDNFWEMGDTGPCGPSSEIHIDLRPESEIGKISGAELVNKDHPMVIEIWNLVFIQFNRLASGNLENLPEKHVDTGMGFERLVMAIQKKTSSYDTDVFQPLINFVANKAGVKYGDATETDIALRVVVDHVRAVAFTIADGQLPSNNGAGYVIRRILRRAVRYGYTYLGFEEPFLTSIVPLLAKQFEGVFPELQAQLNHVERVVKEEELSFQKTLEKGLRMIESYLESNEGDKLHVNGEMIFTLYDTYGFPKDLTMLILRERGLESHVSENWEEEFSQSLELQKSRSRADAEQETGDWVELTRNGTSEFIGYQELTATARIV
jgi:alanyl-tRNA synthetase